MRYVIDRVLLCIKTVLQLRSVQIPKRNDLRANAFASFTGNFEEGKRDNTDVATKRDGVLRSIQLGYSLDPQGLCVTLLGALYPLQEDRINANVDRTGGTKMLEILQVQEEINEALEAQERIREGNGNAASELSTASESDILSNRSTVKDPDGRNIDVIGLSTRNHKSKEQNWWKRLFAD
eukprot:gb/GECG01011207.1/.p1 GENE.gb/GECG01011207.1/~~gb/GECG01011207.1/.p1  ORF type:complete len:180 (+),score=35.22 gb/GECG01011207.1/:1-540(+)